MFPRSSADGPATISKSAYQVSIARGSVSRPMVAHEMGQSIPPENPQDSTNSMPAAHTMHTITKTPENERRMRFPRMASPSPATYMSHLPPRSTPLVRPQSAMGLTSPSSSGHASNYATKYGKSPYARPPSSLGIALSHEDQPNRSYGDGGVSEHVYSDGIPPMADQKEVFPHRSTDVYQDQQSDPIQLQQTTHKSPQLTRTHPNRHRGSYNPHYASGMDKLRDGAKLSHTPTDYATDSHSAVRGTPTQTSQDLRTAWQRLYGQSPGPRRRQSSMDQSYAQNNEPATMHGVTNQPSPRNESQTPQPGATIDGSSSQSPAARDRQVAIPMVAPFPNSGRQSPPGQCSPSQPPSASPHTPYSVPGHSYSSPKPGTKQITNIPDPQSLGPAAMYPSPEMQQRKFSRYGGVHVPSRERASLKDRDSVRNKERRSSTQFEQNSAFCYDSENDACDGPDILPTDSIFDYHDEEDPDGAVDQMSSIIKDHRRTPDPLRKRSIERNVLTIAETARPSGAHNDQPNPSQYARSRSLEDLRESGDESNLSFDVENTFLMVDPSDQSEMGTLKSNRSDMNTKMKRLEGMYAKVMKTLGEKNPHESRTRRWSIGSSDTNSVRHQVHRSKHDRQTRHRAAGLEMKSVNKRFQRLESHVITLARSIAHISSELRTQTTMSREIENVKQEIQELKISRNKPSPAPNERKRNEFDKYRGYNHPLTNPKQVNKLTRFFGQEPSWLEIFLTQLGYQQYVKNFDQEQIGMMELPYMTHEQLKSIGIPMGPRARILQESQRCFKDDEFNIYIV